MTKNQILKAIEMLSAELRKKNATGEICVVGGAAMVLGFDARASTKDVDAVFSPTSEIRAAAKTVAKKLDLPDDWLNDAVKGYVQGNPTWHQVSPKFDNLTVSTPEPNYLLAMKCLSARIDTHDGNDVRFLINHLKLTSMDQVFDIVEKYFPKKQIPAKTMFFIEEIFSDQESMDGFGIPKDK